MKPTQRSPFPEDNTIKLLNPAEIIHDFPQEIAVSAFSELLRDIRGFESDNMRGALIAAQFFHFKKVTSVLESLINIQNVRMSSSPLRVLFEVEKNNLIVVLDALYGPYVSERVALALK